MNIILVMIPLSLVLMGAAAAIFFWAVNHGQFADMQSLGLSPMSDNLPEEKHEETSEKQTEQRSEEHTSELQSRPHLVCRLLLEKKKIKKKKHKRTNRIS